MTLNKDLMSFLFYKHPMIVFNDSKWHHFFIVQYIYCKKWDSLVGKQSNLKNTCSLRLQWGLLFTTNIRESSFYFNQHAGATLHKKADKLLLRLMCAMFHACYYIFKIQFVLDCKTRSSARNKAEYAAPFRPGFSRHLQADIVIVWRDQRRPARSSSAKLLSEKSSYKTPPIFSAQASNRAAAWSVWCRKCSISSSGEGCNIRPPWVQWKVPRLHSYRHKSLGLLNRAVLRKNVSSQLTSFLPCQCGGFVQIGMCQQDCNRVLSLNLKGLRSDLIYIVSTYP